MYWDMKALRYNRFVDLSDWDCIWIFQVPWFIELWVLILVARAVAAADTDDE